MYRLRPAAHMYVYVRGAFCEACPHTSRPSLITWRPSTCLHRRAVNNARAHVHNACARLRVHLCCGCSCSRSGNLRLSTTTHSNKQRSSGGRGELYRVEIFQARF
uniref:Uncharacterized protein n=1 Tax=Haptolina brevifila TaxID=156173 RepID=A0A7S2BVR4_9EUKA